MLKVCVEIAEQLEYRVFQLYNEPRLRDDFHELLAPQSPVRSGIRAMGSGDQLAAGGAQVITRTLFKLCLLSALLERLGPSTASVLRAHFGPLEIRVCPDSQLGDCIPMKHVLVQLTVPFEYSALYMYF